MESNEEEDTRDFIIDPVDEIFASTLKCQICFSYFSSPVTCCNSETSECIFCKPCLQSIILQKDGQGKFIRETCPRCFRRVKELTFSESDRIKWLQSLNINTTIKILVNKLPSVCPHCKKTFSFVDLKRHFEKFCEKIPKKCDLCEGSVEGLGLQHIYETHLRTDCKIECKKCGIKILAKDSNEHLVTCDKDIIECGVCEKSFPRAELETHLHKYGHLEKTMLKCTESQVLKFELKTKEVTVLSQRINFKKLIGKKILIEYFGGLLTLGITENRETYFMLKKKYSQLVAFILSLNFIESNGEIVTSTRTVMDNEKCCILRDYVTDYDDISHFTVMISIMI